MSAIPTLAFRLGEDSISKLEAAAPRRLYEAELLLREKQLLAAIYLMGYAAESRMKAARYRIFGLHPHDEITAATRRLMLPPPGTLPLSGLPHDLEDESVLLISMRKKRGIGYSIDLRKQIHFHAVALKAQWRPSMRYRTTVALPIEATIALEAAKWFDTHYSKLWS